MVSSLMTLLNHAKLKFYDCNYKLNITFAAQNKGNNEGNLDNTSAYRFECIHDIRMVRPPQASGDEDFDKLAAYSRHPFLVGSSIPRVLRTGTCKQNRICRERRSVQPDAA